MLSFADFDRRAAAGEPLRVAFLGGSLTWGANATDPEKFSYRARVRDFLRERYPAAPFRFAEAAIGGTGSQLGLFRLERDVLPFRPDLVFLDYAVNDDLSGTDPERLGSYEAVVRQLLGAGCAVFVTILCVADDVGENPPDRPRREAHRRIAEAYGCPWADVAPHMRAEVAVGRVALDQLWADPCWPNPHDRTHPGDEGYRLYAEAVWAAFGEAVAAGAECRLLPVPLHGDAYADPVRCRLADLMRPSGWQVTYPQRTSIAHDFLMSRWLDMVAVGCGQEAAPFALPFRGTMALLFGEATPWGGLYRVTVDGEPVSRHDAHCPPGHFSSLHKEGNMHHVRVLATGLDPAREHLLVIEPSLKEGEQLRLESLCVAGSGAWVGGKTVAQELKERWNRPCDPRSGLSWPSSS